MKKGNVLKALAGAAGMLILILDGQTAVSGISSGIDICLKTLIPSLFPFFVISGFMVGSISGYPLPLMQWICRLCRIPQGSESLLVIGFLSGYPVGAKNVHDVWACRQISDSNAQRMALLCSNAGPAFIFGILGPIFSDMYRPWMLWGIQIASVFLSAILLPGGETEIVKHLNTQAVNWAKLIDQSIRSMASVCAWVTIFRMVLEFLDRWFFWYLPDMVRILVTGLLELSNGCLELTTIHNPNARFLLSAVLLPFGGICVFMQIHSVFPELDSGFYLKGKILQSILCFLMAQIMVIAMDKQSAIGLAIGIIIIIVLPCFFRKRKKEVAIP